MKNYANTKMPKQLGFSISILLKNLGIDKKVKQYEVINKWPAIVGSKLASVTKVEKVLDGIIFVKVKSSVWRNELLYMKKKIICKINKEIGTTIINDIKFI